MRVAVIGHIEWVNFLEVDAFPGAGDIAHAQRSWEEAAGGGGVAAAEFARLAGACTLYTALGDDAIGAAARAQLSALGIDLRAAQRPTPQRRAVTLVDPSGERTIVVIGEALSPEVADALSFSGADYDAIYFCKGDAALLREARRARVLVATARVLPIIKEAGVELDALVRSAKDQGERYTHGELSPAPKAVVATEGEKGGYYQLASGEAGRYEAAPIEAIVDTYGAGDSFAVGLSYGLAKELPWPEVLDFAAARGAQALSRRGAHGISYNDAKTG